MPAGDEAEVAGSTWQHSALGDARLACCSSSLGSAAVLTSLPLPEQDKHAALLCRRVASPVFEASYEGFVLLTPGRLVFSELLKVHPTLTVVLVESSGSVWVLRESAHRWAVHARFSLRASGCCGEVEQVSLGRDSLTFTWAWREAGSTSAQIFSRRLILHETLTETSLSSKTSVAAVEGWCRLCTSSTTVWLLYSEGVLAVDLVVRSKTAFLFKDLVEPLRSLALKLCYILPASGEELLCRGPAHLMLFRRLRNQTLRLSKVWKLEIQVEDMQVIGGLLIVLDHEALRAYSIQSILQCEAISSDQCMYVRYLPRHQHPRKLSVGLNEEEAMIIGVVAGLEALEVIWTLSVREGVYSLCGLSISDTCRPSLEAASTEPLPPSSRLIASSALNHRSLTDEDSWLSNFDEDLNFRSDLPGSSYQVLLCRHWRAAGCEMDISDVLNTTNSLDVEKVFRFHFERGNVEIINTVHYLAHLMHVFSRSSSDSLVTPQSVYARCLAVSLLCPESIKDQARQDMVLTLLLLSKNYTVVERLLIQWGRKASLERLDSLPFKIRFERPEEACFVNY